MTPITNDPFPELQIGLGKVIADVLISDAVAWRRGSS
jgi:hypothetical protein